MVLRKSSKLVAGQSKSLMSYITGFVLSLLLTMAAYLVAVSHIFEGRLLVAVIVMLALTQLLVQLIFFLHLADESRPWWNLQVFMFMGLIVAILVFGSLWIMSNLDYHTMSPSQIEAEIIKDEGIKK
jgi:cytochrome o ubiquinol oxidase subunit IV